MGLRKVVGLLEAGAVVRLVAPRLDERLAALVAEAPPGRIEHLRRRFKPIDLEGCWLAVAAASDARVNARVARLAGMAGVFCNVSDQPEEGGFTVPAHFRRGGLMVAVSTGGASPLLAARVRDDLAARFDDAWAEYVRLLAAARRAVLARGQAAEANRGTFAALVAADLIEPLRRGDRKELARRLRSACGLDLDELDPPTGEER